METEKVTKKVVYYEDDYTREHTIQETDKFPQIVFKYKPLTMLKMAKLTDKVLGTKGVIGAAEATIEMLAKQLVYWNVTKPSGETVSCNDPAELRKIDSTILNKIASEIRGDKFTPEGDRKALDESEKN